MRKFLTLTATAALVAFGFAGAAAADDFADVAVSISRVTVGTASDGTPISTAGDNGDDGSDATGANDGTGADNTTFSSLGIDENSTVPTGDDTRGNVVLAFTDNTCVDDGTSAAEIKIYDVAGTQSLVGNESALIEVSNDNGATFNVVGNVGPGTGEAGYELDLGGVGGHADQGYGNGL